MSIHGEHEEFFEAKALYRRGNSSHQISEFSFKTPKGSKRSGRVEVSLIRGLNVSSIDGMSRTAFLKLSDMIRENMEAIPDLRLKCIDGGTCHHGCLGTSHDLCQRRQSCGALGTKTWDQLEKEQA